MRNKEKMCQKKDKSREKKMRKKIKNTDAKKEEGVKCIRFSMNDQLFSFAHKKNRNE